VWYARVATPVRSLHCRNSGSSKSAAVQAEAPVSRSAYRIAFVVKISAYWCSAKTQLLLSAARHARIRVPRAERVVHVEIRAPGLIVKGTASNPRTTFQRALIRTLRFEPIRSCARPMSRRDFFLSTVNRSPASRSNKLGSGEGSSQTPRSVAKPTPGNPSRDPASPRSPGKCKLRRPAAVFLNRSDAPNPALPARWPGLRASRRRSFVKCRTA